MNKQQFWKELGAVEPTPPSEYMVLTLQQRDRLESLIKNPYNFNICNDPNSVTYTLYFDADLWNPVGDCCTEKNRNLALMSLITKLIKAGVLTPKEVREALNR